MQSKVYFLYIIRYIEGDIIGAQRFDGGLSNRPEAFFIALADTEVAIFNEDDFYQFWELQKIKQNELLIFYMKTNPLFCEFTIQTLYLIQYELLQK